MGLNYWKVVRSQTQPNSLIFPMYPLATFPKSLVVAMPSVGVKLLLEPSSLYVIINPGPLTVRVAISGLGPMLSHHHELVPGLSIVHGFKFFCNSSTMLVRCVSFFPEVANSYITTTFFLVFQRIT